MTTTTMPQHWTGKNVKLPESEVCKRKLSTNLASSSCEMRTYDQHSCTDDGTCLAKPCCHAAKEVPRSFYTSRKTEGVPRNLFCKAVAFLPSLRIPRGMDFTSLVGLSALGLLSHDQPFCPVRSHYLGRAKNTVLGTYRKPMDFRARMHPNLEVTTQPHQLLVPWYLLRSSHHDSLKNALGKKKEPGFVEFHQ